MGWILAGAALVALMIGFVWRHTPTRKRLFRTFSPQWRRHAKPGTYTAAEIEAEAGQMLVSSTVLRDACDIVWEDEAPEPPAAIFAPFPHGTTIWVNTRHIPQFISEVLPRIQSPFVLLNGRQNNATSEFDLDGALSHPTLLRWFMENFEHPAGYLQDGRVVPLPLGLNYHNLDPRGKNRLYEIGNPALPEVQQLDLKRIRATLPPLRDKPLSVYCNFHLHMDTFLRHPHAQKRAVARQEAIDALQGKPFVDWERHYMPRNLIWARHAKYSFEASPRGNSIDCHRTWEALLLGTIPIVKTTLMDPIYEGLPVAIVDDWSDVTEERLAAWKAEFLPWFEAPLPDRLLSQYWIDRFNALKRTA